MENSNVKIGGVFGAITVIGILYAFTQPYSQRIDSIQENIREVERRLVTHESLPQHPAATGQFASHRERLNHLEEQVRILRESLLKHEIEKAKESSKYIEKVENLERLYFKGDK